MDMVNKPTPQPIGLTNDPTANRKSPTDPQTMDSINSARFALKRRAFFSPSSLPPFPPRFPFASQTLRLLTSHPMNLSLLIE